MDYQQLLTKVKYELIEEIRDNKNTCLQFGYNTRSKEIRNYFKQTERRLYNYPELLKNIDRYKLDILDLKKEGIGRKSGDIVKMKQSGVRLDEDEILEVKVLTIDRKIERDEKEVNEINYALDGIKREQFRDIIHYKYFKNMGDIEIAQNLHIAERTVRKYKKQLMNKIMVRLYGADIN